MLRGEVGRAHGSFHRIVVALSPSAALLKVGGLDPIVGDSMLWDHVELALVGRYLERVPCLVKQGQLGLIN